MGFKRETSTASSSTPRRNGVFITRRGLRITSNVIDYFKESVGLLAIRLAIRLVMFLFFHTDLEAIAW